MLASFKRGAFLPASLFASQQSRLQEKFLQHLRSSEWYSEKIFFYLLKLTAQTEVDIQFKTGNFDIYDFDYGFRYKRNFFILWISSNKILYFTIPYSHFGKYLFPTSCIFLNPGGNSMFNYFNPVIVPENSRLEEQWRVLLHFSCCGLLLYLDKQIKIFN